MGFNQLLWVRGQPEPTWQLADTAEPEAWPAAGHAGAPGLWLVAGQVRAGFGGLGFPQTASRPHPLGAVDVTDALRASSRRPREPLGAGTTFLAPAPTPAAAPPLPASRYGSP